MIFCRFFAAIAAILLCSAPFCGNFAPRALADTDVAHAYRKPSEADLQWLFADITPSTPDTPGIVLVGFTHPTSNVLMPRGGPCSPVNVPIPMPLVPPPPQTVQNRRNAGLAPDVDGVVNIAPAVADSATPVVQMTAGERLPPPSELPKEASLAVPLANVTPEPLPMPTDREYVVTEEMPCDPCKPVRSFDADYGGYCQNRPRFYVPDMLGGNAWFTGHSVGVVGTSFTSLTMLLTRPNVAERFNADVQNRIWADYRHWNNAVSMRDNNVFEDRAVEQFSFGLEKRILRNSSLELRVPLISQFASKQTAGNFATSVELGNISVFLKQVLHQGSRWTISSGAGVTLPTAEDGRFPTVAAQLKNNTYYLVSFLGAQWHPNDNTFGHFVVQADMPIEKNELVSGVYRERVTGQQVIRTGIQLGHWIYRSGHSNDSCRLGAFAEVNYAVVTDGSPQYVLPNGTYISALDSRKSTLTAAVGVPMVFGRLTCANSLILPISGSNHPFSVGYSFALSQQF